MFCIKRAHGCGHGRFCDIKQTTFVQGCISINLRCPTLQRREHRRRLCLTSASESSQPADVPNTATRRQGAVPPWALMGRMIPADQIALSMEQKQVLITSAAARLSGLDVDLFDAQLQELLMLLPDMRDRLLALKPAVLVELCGDTRGVAVKLVQLREMFPDANVSIIIAKRPTLLTAAEWAGVQVAAGKLAAMFPEGGVGRLVTQQPLLLVEDVDEVVGELERLMPGGRSGRELLAANPDLLTAVVSNRKLSIW